jgi:hypothetical protein
MAAPTAVKTRAAALLDLLWDAAVAGTMYDIAWEHEAREFNISGRRVILNISLGGNPGYPIFYLIVKRP